ncbi:MAG: transglutaminase, partial [Deltaproteobacteria bacterium]|nr:transglutaminase [Deltaproteobacteria bacterium]
REKKEYKDYFFGNMDPYRLVIQKDIDIPLTPPAAEPIMLSMALQDAAALCDTMLSHPGFLVNDGWKYEVKEVTGREE